MLHYHPRKWPLMGRGAGGRAIGRKKDWPGRWKGGPRWLGAGGGGRLKAGAMLGCVRPKPAPCGKTLGGVSSI